MSPALWELLTQTVHLDGEQQRLLLASSQYRRVAELARHGQWDLVRQVLRAESILPPDPHRQST